MLANILAAAMSSALVPVRIRSALLRSRGVDVGPGAAVASGSMIKSRELSIGGGAFINHGCFIDAGPVAIGSGAFLGPGVKLLSNDHELGGPDRRAAANVHRPIVIGDGAWIGANAVVLGGVTVAAGCVIGAGAVVTKDTEPDGVYIGVPAARLSDLPA